MEKLRSKVRYYVVVSTLIALSALCLVACGDDEETGPQGGSSGSSGDGDGDGDGDAGESGSSGDGDGDSGEGGTSGNGGDGDGDGDSGDGGDSGNGGDGDGDGDVEACLDAPEPTTSDEFLNRECPPTECEPFDNEERLPFYVPGEDLPDALD